MTILQTELEYYKSNVVSSSATNGGRMSANQAISGVVNNVWPHVLQAERLTGSTLFRKLFLKVSNDNDETLLSSTVWNDLPTAADDWVVLFVATQRDTEAGITGTERIYGAGNLNTDVTAGGSTIIVDVDDATIVGIFADGDTIRITDMPDPDSPTGNEELLTITGVPSVVGTVITITVTGTLANAYTTASGTRIMSLLDAGDINCSVDSWVETSGSGTYDEVTNPLVTDNIGTVDETWTLTFTDATNFTVVGDSLGSVGSGTTGADFAPVNADFAKPYMTLEFAGWAGAWANGDTIVFETHPASFAFWLKREVPATCPPLANNKNTTVVSGESA